MTLRPGPRASRTALPAPRGATVDTVPRSGGTAGPHGPAGPRSRPPRPRRPRRGAERRPRFAIAVTAVFFALLYLPVGA